MTPKERSKMTAAKLKAKKVAEERAAKKKSGVTKPGVIAAIQDIIEKLGPITKARVHKALARKFPDRDSDKMMKTMNCQIGGKKRPTRMEREKKIKFVINNKEQFSILKRKNFAKK